MNISCSNLVCQLEAFPTIEETVRHIHSLGFNAIDWAAFEGWQNVNPPWLVENYEPWTATFETLLAETGMRISSINASPSVAIADEKY